MFDDKLGFVPSTEMEVVYGNNHYRKEEPLQPEDPLEILGINGKRIGYTWNYGDSIELDIHLNNTVLHADRQHLQLFELYLKDKEVEVNFIDMRGNVSYTFYVPAALHTSLKLNYNEETTIERNEYSCTLVLINPYDLSRINLLTEPYRVFVK